MGAPSKRAKKIRAASEFDVARLKAALEPPNAGRGSIFAWSLSDIFAARDAQLRGNFALPARLAESMRTDDALAVAYENRLAPQRCIPIELIAAKGGKGPSIANEAEAIYGQEGVGFRPETRADIEGCFVNHGVAFGINIAAPREDGSRVDFEVRYWPIEYVRWDVFYQCFVTRVDPETMAPGDAGDGRTYEVPIVHGDGRWIIFQKHEIDSFKQEAAILPAALVWARHAFAIRDWSKGSVAHGAVKMVGELPEGVPLNTDTGALTTDAAAFLELLRHYASSDSPVGIRPSGAKTEFVVNNSTAWQVWNELVLNGEKAAARIYLGTDGTLGSNGGAPGVDIATLFGVATTRVQGDLACIERAIKTGSIEPWCAVNFGDSTLAPSLKYCMPDPDAEARQDALAKRETAFFASLKSARENGVDVTQEYVEKLAKAHDIEAPTMKVAAAPAAEAPAAPATPVSPPALSLIR